MSFLMKVKEESKNGGLKLNIQKTKIESSSPIISWGQEKMETLRDFISLGSKITADGECSHEFKRYLLLGRKAIKILDSILKKESNTLQQKYLVTKVHLVKAIVFPVVMYRCENWNIKKAEHKIIDAFKLWCYRRLFFHFYLFILVQFTILY